MESNVKNLYKDINMMLGLMELLRQFKETTLDRYDVCILSIDPDDKRVHIYAGIDYLAYALGEETSTEPFDTNDIKERKYFTYEGYTFFELSDNDPDGGVYYR